MDFLVLKRRLFVIFPLQLFLVVCSLYLAFLVRFDFSIPDVYRAVFYRILPAVILIKLLIFGYFKLYSGWWRYVSMDDLVVIFKANFIGSAGVIVYNFFVYRLELVSRTILLLDGLFCFLLVAGIRFFIRAFRENFYPMPVNKAEKTRILIVGAGDAGQMIARELHLNRRLTYDAIGFIDDDRRKQKTRFRGLPVLGTCKEIPAVCRKKQIEEVIIAIPSATGKQIRTIVDYCQKANVRFKTLPGVGGLLDGSVSVERIKDVSLDDLLGARARQTGCREDFRLSVWQAGSGDGGRRQYRQ